jgi:hypothetical protein
MSLVPYLRGYFVGNAHPRIQKYQRNDKRNPADKICSSNYLRLFCPDRINPNTSTSPSNAYCSTTISSSKHANTNSDHDARRLPRRWRLSRLFSLALGLALGRFRFLPLPFRSNLPHHPLSGHARRPAPRQREASTKYTLRCAIPWEPYTLRLQHVQLHIPQPVRFLIFPT